MDGTWILLYVQPNCRLCDVILKAVESDDHPQVAQHVIVIEGSVAARQLPAIAGQFSRVPQTAWHADPQRQAFEQLKLPGVPVIVGMRGRAIEWTLSGVLLKPATLESLLSSWIAR